MAQVRALVRESVLEELFAGEKLEIRVLDPALAHPLIGHPVNVLEQQQPDHEAGLDPRPTVLAVKRCDLAVDPVPVDLAGKQNQLVLHVDNLVQPRPEQIVRSSRLVLLRPHRLLRCTTESWSERKGNPKTKLQGSGVSSPQSLQSQMPPNPKNRLPLNRLEPCSRTTDESPSLGQMACATFGCSRANALIWIMCGDPSQPAISSRLPRSDHHGLIISK